MPLGYCHMPIYECELEEGQDCSVCGGNFTLQPPALSEALDAMSVVQEGG